MPCGCLAIAMRVPCSCCAIAIRCHAIATRPPSSVVDHVVEGARRRCTCVRQRALPSSASLREWSSDSNWPRRDARSVYNKMQQRQESPTEARQLEPVLRIPSRCVLCGACEQLLRASKTPRMMSLRQRSRKSYDSDVILTATMLVPYPHVFSVDSSRASTPVSALIAKSIFRV